MVRAAVLKMKDPRQIIRDMEKLDEMGKTIQCIIIGCVVHRINTENSKNFMVISNWSCLRGQSTPVYVDASLVLPEFNPVQMPQLNEKVLRDKRKKLRETFERIVRLYERENPETYKELRKLEIEYETKRGQLSLYFDSVKVCVCVCGLKEPRDLNYLPYLTLLFIIVMVLHTFSSMQCSSSAAHVFIACLLCCFSFTYMPYVPFSSIRWFVTMRLVAKKVQSRGSTSAQNSCPWVCQFVLGCVSTGPSDAWLFKQNAELVEVDSIPLPEMPHAPSSILIQDIPLPGAQPPSILKKGSSFGSVLGRRPPALSPFPVVQGFPIQSMGSRTRSMFLLPTGRREGVKTWTVWGALRNGLGNAALERVFASRRPHS